MGAVTRRGRVTVSYTSIFYSFNSFNMKYKEYTLEFRKVTLREAAYGKVLEKVRTLPCLVSTFGRVIPIHTFLPGKAWWGELQLFTIEGNPLEEYSLPIPEDFHIDSETEQKTVKECEQWNSELDNWVKKTYVESWMDYDDSDNRRDQKSYYTQWEHPVYGVSNSAPQPRDTEKVLDNLRRSSWNRESKLLRQECAEAKWLELYSSYLDEAILDGGKSFRYENDLESLQEVARIQQEKANARKDAQRAFETSCQVILDNNPMKGYSLYFSGKKVWIKKDGKAISLKGYTSPEDLEAFWKEYSRRTSTGKPFPKKKVN